jgi:hypothetical protein
LVAFLVFPFIQNILLATNDAWFDILIGMIAIKVSPEGIVPFVITLGALAAGGIPGYMIYIKNADKPNQVIPESGARRKVYNFFRHRWYINQFYFWLLNKFLNFAAWWRDRIDNKIIDGIDFKSSSLAQTIAAKVRWFDDNVVDDFAEGISTMSVNASDTGLRTQTGRVNDYVAMIIFGIGMMLIIMLIVMGVI